MDKLDQLQAACDATGLKNLMVRRTAEGFHEPYSDMNCASTGSIYLTYVFEVSDDSALKAVVRIADHTECYPPQPDVDFQWSWSPDELTLEEVVARLAGLAQQELEFHASQGFE